MGLFEDRIAWRARYAPSVGGRPGGAGFAPFWPRIRPALGWVAS